MNPNQVPMQSSSLGGPRGGFCDILNYCRSYRKSSSYVRGVSSKGLRPGAHPCTAAAFVDPGIVPPDSHKESRGLSVSTATFT